MDCFEIFCAGGQGAKSMYTSNLRNSLCKSKVVGDLGFCQMEDKNKALIAKVSNLGKTNHGWKCSNLNTWEAHPSGLLKYLKELMVVESNSGS